MITKALRAASLATIAALAIALAACGGGESSDDNASTGTAGGEATSGVAALDQQLERLYRGTHEAPPASGPAAERGKEIWFLTIGQTSGVSASASSGAEEAAKALGWKVTVFDGQYDTNRIQGGIRQALAAKADGIAVYATDCAPIQSALRAARQADVPVVAVEAVDCDASGGTALFADTVSYAEGPFRDYIEAQGAAQAAWTAVDSGGKAHVLVLHQTDIQSPGFTYDGFTRAIAACQDCVVYELKHTGAELGPPLQEKIEQFLLRHPDVDYIEASYDAPVTLSIVPAVRAAGRSREIKVIGGEGTPPNVDLVRKDAGQAAGVGVPVEWEGWAAMDALNRIFAGAEPAGSGIGLQVFDREHNLPASGGYESPVDFRAAYETVWSGGGAK